MLTRVDWLTKVVSTKLSNAEHEALLEVVNLLCQSISEFVRESIMIEVCGMGTIGIPEELGKRIEEAQSWTYRFTSTRRHHDEERKVARNRRLIDLSFVAKTRAKMTSERVITS